MYLDNIVKNYHKPTGHNLTSPDYSFDHMVYARVFEGCNLHCDHCFIPSNPKKMDIEQFKNHHFTQLLIDNARVQEGSAIYIQWHGGEPTLLGLDYLKQCIELVEEDKRFKYIHGIQTNLMNFHIDANNWSELYKKYFNAQLGISWDYGIRHTKSKTITPEESNSQFEKQFWQNVQLAQSHQLDLYMVVTATKKFFERFKNPMDFYHMMAEKGITKLNFERITKNGYARQSWDILGLSNAQYSKYMSRFYNAYVLFKNSNSEIDLHVSPFDGLSSSVATLLLDKKTPTQNEANIWDVMSYKNQGYGCWSGQCDTRFHTIDANGYKHGCTAITSETDNKNKDLQKSLGEETTQKILWIGKMPKERNIILESRQKRQESCQTCEFLKICSSGCLSIEKFDESGECSGAKTLFTTIKNNIEAVI